MPLTHIGDLSRHFVFQTQNARIKAAMTETSLEMTNGLAADKSKHLNGRIEGWASLERSISLLQSYENAAHESKAYADAKQLVLEKVQGTTSDLRNLFVTASLGTNELIYASNATRAADAMQEVVNDFNSSVAGRSLFAGIATDGAALATADTMLTDIRLAVASSLTINDFVATIDAWFFDTGGGFETLGYVGSTIDTQPVEIGAGQTVDLSQRADSDAIRTTLRNLTIVALMTDSALGFTSNDFKSASLTAADGLISAQNQLTIDRSTLGFAQSQVNAVIAEHAAEQKTFAIARNTLIGVDPYEAATKIENLRIQMETIYTLTSRMSQLSLARYL